LSSLSLGERFRSEAAFGVMPSAEGFGAGWEIVVVSSACSEIGDRTAVVSWLFTSKPSRLVDLGSSCCICVLRRPFFCVATSPCEIIRLGPSNFLLLNLYIRAYCGTLCKIQNPSNFRGMLLPPKNPKLLTFASRLPA